MKTIILTFVLGALFSISNLCANEPNKKVLTNEEKTESGYIKESTYFDEDSTVPSKKEVCNYDLNRNILKKTVYKWNKDDGWMEDTQDNYDYNKSGKIAKITRAGWDKKQKDWSANVKEYIYTYNTDGELIAIK